MGLTINQPEEDQVTPERKAFDPTAFRASLRTQEVDDEVVPISDPGGPQPVTQDKVRVLGDPVPFDIDGTMDQLGAERPEEDFANDRNVFSNVFSNFARPFLATGYVTAAALNRGVSGFSAHLDGVQRYVEYSTGLTGKPFRGELWEEAARVYADNAEYWQKRADKVGVTFFDELIGEAVGGFVPGVTQFALDVASGLTFSYMDGAVQSYEEGDSPFMGGMVQAAKTGILHNLFRAMAPLKNYLRAPLMGSVFGIEEAAIAPEGEKARAFGKGFGIGLGYGLTSPGGNMGLNEVGRNINQIIPGYAERQVQKMAGPVPAERLTGKALPELTRQQQRAGAKVVPEKALEPGAVEKKAVVPEREIVDPVEIEKSIRKDFKDRALEEWETLPENVFVQDLRKRGGIKLSQSLRDFIGKDQLRDFETRWPGLFSTKGKVSLDDALESSKAVGKNYRDAEEMFSELAGMRRKEDFVGDIEKGAEQIIQEELRLRGEEAERVQEAFPAEDTLAEKPVISEEQKQQLRDRGFANPQIDKMAPDAAADILAVPEGEGGKKRQRQFLKTIAEASETEPDLAQRVKDVDPQEYVVQPNVESRAKAVERIEREGIGETVDYVLSEAELGAEKGATFVELIERFQREGDYDRAVEMVESYDLQSREGGRFNQAAAMFGATSPVTFIRWANKQLRSVRSKYGWLDVLFGRKPEAFTLTPEEQKTIMAEYKEINEMPPGIDKNDRILGLVSMVAEKVPPSISELIDAYRYQNMLSSPKTQMRNIGENIGNTFLTRPIDITTKGGIDYVQSLLTGKARSDYVLDAPVYLKTAINAVPNAVTAFVEVMKMAKGVQIGKPDIGIEGRTEFQMARLSQLPPSLTVVSRFMEAADAFNMSLIGAGEMALLKKKGFSDAEAYKQAQRTAEIMLYRNRIDPGDPDLSLPSKALSSLGKMVEESRKLPVLGTLSKWFLPFIRTPMNKSMQMVERSPVGVIRDPRDLSRESAAKLLAGGVATAFGALMAAQNQTTWTAPADRKQKELFYATGRKPFSVRIGNRWVPVWYLGPWALAFMIPTAIKHFAEDDATAFTDDATEKILKVSEGLARFVGSQSSTQSIGALFSALGGDIDYNFSSQTAFTLQQAIPMASLVRYVNTIVDPIYRKPEGFIENIETNIFGLSQKLEAHQNPFGEEARRDPINYFLPYDTGKIDDRFEQQFILAKNNARQRAIGRKMDKITDALGRGKITPEESMDMVQKLIEAQVKTAEKFEEETQQAAE